MALTVGTPTVGTTATTSHTTASGTTLLVVTVSIKQSVSGTISGTFNGTAMTLAGSYNETTYHVGVLYLVSPAITTANVVISYSGTVTALRVGICSVSGNVNTVTPVGATAFGENSSDPITYTLTTDGTSGVIFDAMGNNNSNGNAFSAGAGQTQIYNVTQMASNRGVMSSYELFSTSGNKTISWDGGTPTAGWAYAIVEFKELPAATSSFNPAQWFPF